MRKEIEQVLANGNVEFGFDNSENTKQFYERMAKYTGYKIFKKGSRYLLENKNNIIALKQITYLGKPHEAYKKRAQMPTWFPEVYEKHTNEGKKVFFMGVYTYKDNVILFNFRLDSYKGNKFNNSSAHVLVNDIYQATTNGYYKKIDKNNNIIDCFRIEYLDAIVSGEKFINSELNVIEEFNKQFDFNQDLHVMKCVPEMYNVAWPDRNQGEWPGFYLEYRFDKFLKEHNSEEFIKFQKIKDNTNYDFDLFFPTANFYGDLKSSNISKKDSPGNDKRSLDEYLQNDGKFWYLIYEHDTMLAKENGNKATIEWNEFRFANGYKKMQKDGKINWNLSYKNKLKETVTYRRMFVLEVNNANKHLVFKDFNQGVQPDGSKRKGKYMIKKKDIDNFIIYRY